MIVFSFVLCCVKQIRKSLQVAESFWPVFRWPSQHCRASCSSHRSCVPPWKKRRTTQQSTFYCSSEYPWMLGQVNAHLLTATKHLCDHQFNIITSYLSVTIYKIDEWIPPWSWKLNGASKSRNIGKQVAFARQQVKKKKKMVLSFARFFLNDETSFWHVLDRPCTWCVDYNCDWVKENNDWPTVHEILFGIGIWCRNRPEASEPCSWWHSSV